MFLVSCKSNISCQISFTWYSIYVHVSVNNSFKFQNHEIILYMVRFICIYIYIYTWSYEWFVFYLDKDSCNLVFRWTVGRDCIMFVSKEILCFVLRKAFFGPSQSRWIARPSTVVPAGLQVHSRSRAIFLGQRFYQWWTTSPKSVTWCQDMGLSENGL